MPTNNKTEAAPGFPQVKVRDVLADFGLKIPAAFKDLPDVRTEIMDVKTVTAVKFQIEVLRKDISALTTLFDNSLIAFKAQCSDDDALMKVDPIISREGRGRKSAPKEVNPLEDF